MSLRVNNLQLPVEQTEAALADAAARRLGIPAGDVLSWRILRKSLDARSRHDLRFVYSVAVELPAELESRVQESAAADVQSFIPAVFDDPAPGATPLDHRPVIVGSGPAGLLAGYYLALKGFRPLILERGKPVKERVSAVRAFDAGGPHDPENNYLFGEGGAGCFSDGKLTCRMSGPDVDWVLRAFVECGGRESLTYEHRPHLGSNKLPMICRNFRRRIEAAGGEYRFDCRMEGIEIADGRVRGLNTSGGFIPSTQVVLGMGHSARDTYHMLHDAEVPLRAKAFQLGLRIEQPQEQVNRWKYGRAEYLDLLGAADYTLVSRGERDLYTFCMCAGGIVIPSISEPRQFCTNGMSNSRHDTPFANSGLMITLEPHEFGSSHPLAGVELQRRYEGIAFEMGRGNYLAPIQWAKDFLAGRSTRVAAAATDERALPSSYQRGTVAADVRGVLPPVVIRAIEHGLPLMDQRWRGEFLKGATLTGPEMRGSSPVRIDRDPESRQTPGIAGLFPVGEGAGYAGGIVSAAVDGLRSARAIVQRYAPMR
ncbi:MAG: FAD-dependent oxidoreductase [Planctomycetaceae bacterium]|nr:FAD-dependent oxidoreductase [Planctomycetaceae bacterium]